MWGEQPANAPAMSTASRPERAARLSLATLNWHVPPSRLARCAGAVVFARRGPYTPAPRRCGGPNPAGAVVLARRGPCTPAPRRCGGPNPAGAVPVTGRPPHLRHSGAGLLAGVALQPFFKLDRRQRPCDVKALSRVATQLAQAQESLFVLHPFGRHAPPQAVGELDRRSYYRLVGLSSHHVLHEQAVDLQVGEGHVPQLAQRIAAGPVVVER